VLKVVMEKNLCPYSEIGNVVGCFRRSLYSGFVVGDFLFYENNVLGVLDFVYVVVICDINISGFTL
jgi:hypothetical protein